MSVLADDEINGYFITSLPSNVCKNMSYRNKLYNSRFGIKMSYRTDFCDSEGHLILFFKIS
jgi:hypothetical protein